MTPVEGLAAVNEPVKGTNCLLHWDGGVRSVSKHDIDIVHLQTGKRVVETLDQVLARKTTRVELLSTSTEEDLECKSGGMRGCWTAGCQP